MTDPQAHTPGEEEPQMSRHLASVEHIDEVMQECITNCSECHDICMAMVNHCLEKGGDYAAPRLIRVLLDCAQACDVSRNFMLRDSPLHPGYCRACAHACGSCTSACEKFPDDEVMRACAEACRRCMESCRAMGGPDRHGHA
jgi:hypothetical protein